MTSRCLCCAKGDLAALGYLDDFMGRPLYRCSNCGHVQTESPPSPERLQEYYAAAYSHGRSAYMNDKYCRLMERRAAAQLDFCAPFLALEGQQLLDLGCGYGALVGAAGKRGMNAIGLEFDPRTVEYGQTAGLDIRQVESEEALAGQIHDHNPALVALSHVLEHLRDPAALLSACDASMVFIEVPAYDFRIAEQFKDEEGHLNFFQRAGLEQLLRRLDFQIVSMGEYGPGLELFWRRRWQLVRKVMRLATGDYFFQQYSLPRQDGIWVRALAKGKACKS